MAHHALAGEKNTADGPPRVIGYADDASCYLVPSVGLTWARTGQTPVLRDGDRSRHLAVICLITETGDLSDQIQDGSYQGDDVVRCLRQVRGTSPTTLTLIWDGASLHYCARRPFAAYPDLWHEKFVECLNRLFNRNLSILVGGVSLKG